MLSLFKRLWRIRQQHKRQKREGYSVKFGTRSEWITYREGEKSLSADVRWSDGYKLYTSSIKEWKTPMKGQKLTPSEFDKVLGRIKDYLSAYDPEVILDDTPPMSREQYIAQQKERLGRLGWTWEEEGGTIRFDPPGKAKRET
jgi:hypothetical protein